MAKQLNIDDRPGFEMAVSHSAGCPLMLKIHNILISSTEQNVIAASPRQLPPLKANLAPFTEFPIVLNNVLPFRTSLQMAVIISIIKVPFADVKTLVMTPALGNRSDFKAPVPGEEEK